MNNSHWRLIISSPAVGKWNMALDEAILESVIAGSQPPTLRLYTWQPACLSLGHAQPAGQVDLPALQSLGWDLVRRPTGGRAILHTDELTYSICAHQDSPLMFGSILESYRRISVALIEGLNNLGIQAKADSRYAVPDGATPNAAVCFEVPSNYEITAEGKKIIGSAQARRSQGVLQHGSFPLFGDLARITDVLYFDDDEHRKQARQRLLAHAATAESFLGDAPGWDQAVQAMVQAFTSVVNIDLQPSEPSLVEIQRANELVADKFGNPAWTLRI